VSLATEICVQRQIQASAAGGVQQFRNLQTTCETFTTSKYAMFWVSILAAVGQPPITLTETDSDTLD
jgi:hypothetical protein